MSEQACKVLVIDDDRDGADSAVLLLRMWGHEAVAAYSPTQATELARQLDPDVVLVDIGLPGKNGFEVAKEIKQCCPHARFVALTGFTQADIVRRARQDGFADHLMKPAQPSVLKNVVENECAVTQRRAK